VLARPPTANEVRSVFVTQARNYGDLMWLPRREPDNLASRVEVVGGEHLKAALAEGRGAIVGSLHLGNLEVVSYAAVNWGVPVMLPVERLDPPKLLKLMIDLRQRAGMVCEPVGLGAFDRIREALRRNSIVGIGVDRITLGDGDVLQFCGRSANLPTAAALIALRTGAPLLPIGSERLPGDRFRLRVGPSIPLRRSGPLRKDLRLISERLLADLEVFLKLTPTQWVVFHPIWSDQPRPGMTR
jgi:KDO2-lipid IV(A) lauroyltransferase